MKIVLQMLNAVQFKHKKHFLRVFELYFFISNIFETCNFYKNAKLEEKYRFQVVITNVVTTALYLTSGLSQRGTRQRHGAQ